MIDKPTAFAPPAASGLTLADIYYVLFRHKWKILILSVAGLLAALVLPLVWHRPYQSEAKVLILYVLETRSPGQVGANDQRVKSPDERGENVINTELEILTSLDLAQEVAKSVGPEKILAKAGGGNDPYAAAVLIHRNLLPDIPKKSNVIRILFQHPDETIVQPVLGKVIDIYLKKHIEIHRGVGAFDEFLNKETDELRSRLAQTEESLRRAKTNAHIISLDDSKKVFTEQLAKIQQAIFDAEAELAERRASVNEMGRLLNPEMRPASPTNAPAATNSAPVAPDKVAEYKRVTTLLEGLLKREEEALVQFTPESSRVKEVRGQIAENEKLKQQLEAENPGLLTVKVTETRIPTDSAVSAVNPRLTLASETARVSALESKIKVLLDQMAQIGKQASAVDDSEGSITELQRKKELEEQHYKYFSEKLEQSRIDDALAAGRVSNIKIIQAPSPPFRENTKLTKVMAMLCFGGFAAAIGLAFLLELYFDRSVRRPSEIENKLGLPLFLTMPLINQNGKTHFLKAVPALPLLTENSTPSPEGKGRGEGAPPEQIQTPAILDARPSQPPAWDGDHALRPFFEALRDRLILFFEMRNLTHKPKLVAVTSCAEGSGVTTTAAGLAATLSETGEGNVLLVDMNPNGAARQFYKGKLECCLEDVLENGDRTNALVQDNLYIVSEAATSDRLPRVLPKRFKHLVPRLKASDYDYIIFDLPPISQISATARLARYMDMVFVVAESEKTDMDVLKRATALLTETKANVGIVLNKAKTYVPKQLQQEL